MSGHEVVKCSTCNAVIRRCRCPGPHPVKYEVCDRCKANTSAAAFTMSTSSESTAEAPNTPLLEARVVHLERALKTIATIEHCEECDTYGEPDEPFSEDEILQHRLDHPVTHETTFFGLQKLLCTDCAERVTQAHRKAESKGCGKQPEVVPYSGARRITTTLALEALKDQPTTTASAPAVAVMHNISMTRVRVLWDKLAEELGIIRAAEEDPER